MCWEWELTDGMMAIAFFTAYYESEYDRVTAILLRYCPKEDHTRSSES